MKKYGRFDDDAWKNVEDLKEYFNLKDTLKTYGFSYLGFVICVCYFEIVKLVCQESKGEIHVVEH